MLAAYLALLAAAALLLTGALMVVCWVKEDRFSFDDEAAVLMLVRAIINHQLCGRRLPQEAEKFISWVRKNGFLSSYAA